MSGTPPNYYTASSVGVPDVIAALNNLARVVSQIAGQVGLAAAAAVAATPANPAGTTSTTLVMMGLALAVTPRQGGRIFVSLSGDIYNAGAVGDGAVYQLRYGTGAAPANGAALAGNAAGSTPAFVNAATAQKSPFSIGALVTSLSAGTAYWFDLALAATTGGTAVVENLAAALFEV